MLTNIANGTSLFLPLVGFTLLLELLAGARRPLLADDVLDAAGVFGVEVSLCASEASEEVEDCN